MASTRPGGSTASHPTEERIARQFGPPAALRTIRGPAGLCERGVWCQSEWGVMRLVSADVSGAPANSPERLSMASGICPVADSRTARSWPTELPGGGQVFCP